MAAGILAIEGGTEAERAHLAEESGRRGWKVVSGGGPSVVFVRLDGSPRRSRAEGRIGAGACGFVSFPDGTTISTALDDLYDRMLDEGWIVGGGRLESDAFLLTAERGVLPVPGGDWAGPFLDLLETRAGSAFHKTKMESDRLPERILPAAQAAAALAERWARLGLFPGYSRGGALYPGAEFGFVAARAEEGCVVTSRGGSKSFGGADGFSWLRAIDSDGTLMASGAAKASLNAPLALRILEIRPEIGLVVHLHAFLPGATAAAETTAPGTFEDWEAIRPAVEAGAKAIVQPLHGSLILLEPGEDLLGVLEGAGLYKARSDLYETAYERFLGGEEGTHLDRVVAGLHLGKTGAKALDLCCGTGASTRALIRSGLRDPDFADGSPSMLAQAEASLGRRGVLVRLDGLGALDPGTYDLVQMRQAFNYLRAWEIPDFLVGIRSLLRRGGIFAFNTFVPPEAGTSKARAFESERDGVLSRTFEANEISDADVLHVQRTEIVDLRSGRWEVFFDANRFQKHGLDFLSKLLAESGFDVDLRLEGGSAAFVCRISDPEEDGPWRR